MRAVAGHAGLDEELGHRQKCAIRPAATRWPGASDTAPSHLRRSLPSALCFSQHQPRGQVHAERAAYRAGREGRGHRQRPDQGGGDRDERAAARGAHPPGRQLRDGQARARGAHAEVQRQQAGAQRVRALRPAEAHDQGRDQAGDAVLDAGGDSAPGEAGDGAGLRAARLRHHGEEPQGGRQDGGQAAGGGRRQARARRQAREHDHGPDRGGEHADDQRPVQAAQEVHRPEEPHPRPQGGVQQLQDLPDSAALHDAQGHDQGHHAQPGLHGGLPRGGRIADGAAPPLAPRALARWRPTRRAQRRLLSGTTTRLLLLSSLLPSLSPSSYLSSVRSKCRSARIFLPNFVSVSPRRRKQ